MEEYRTTDLAQAAALFVHEFPLLGVYPEQGDRFVFVFEDTPELNHITDQFWKGNLAVEPKAYYDAIRRLKARVIEGKRQRV